MAVYTFTKIEEGLLGDNENIKISGEVSSLNSLLASTGSNYYILRSFNLWSLNIDQVRQPIIIKKSSPDGNDISYTKVPQVDAYQVQSAITDFGADRFPFDGDSKLIYNILPNSNIRMTLNFDRKAYDELSDAALLAKQVGGDSEIFKNAMREVEISEFEEEPVKVVSIVDKLVEQEEPEENETGQVKLKSMKLSIEEPEEQPDTIEEKLSELSEIEEPEESQEIAREEIKKEETKKKKKKTTKKTDKKPAVINYEMQSTIIPVLALATIVTISLMNNKIRNIIGLK